MSIAVLVAFAVSVGVNVVQFWQSSQWKEAFFKQVGTTAEVEMLFKESEADISYENILVLSKHLFGGSVKEVQADQLHVRFGADERAIQLIDSTLLFREGEYYGTEVHLPGH